MHDKVVGHLLKKNIPAITCGVNWAAAAFSEGSLLNSEEVKHACDKEPAIKTNMHTFNCIHDIWAAFHPGFGIPKIWTTAVSYRRDPP